MTANDELKYLNGIKRTLLGAGIVALLVGIKLMLSFLFPGLKTSGELLLSGFILLVYSAKLFRAYRGLGGEGSWIQRCTTRQNSPFIT